MIERKKKWPSPAALRGLAFGLFTVTLVVTALTAIDYGIASDVGNYFYSSLRQLAWAGDLWVALINGEPTVALNQDRVFEHWRWYAERIPHPPLSRELSGISWFFLRDLTDPLTAYRGAVMFTFAALTASVGVYTAWRTRSLGAGLAAGLAVPAFPVLFAHGHLAHTDLFLTAFWFWSVASLDYAVKEGGTGWFLSSGIFLGAAAATKFSGLLLLPVLAIWLVANRSGLSAFLVLCLTGALVFVAVNPVMWVDPVQGVADYLQAGLDRAVSDDTRIATEYFGGVFLFRPPWHYPYVWTVIVFPLTLLAAALAGLFAPRSGPLRGLAFLNMAVLYGARRFRPRLCTTASACSCRCFRCTARWPDPDPWPSGNGQPVLCRLFTRRSQSGAISSLPFRSSRSLPPPHCVRRRSIRINCPTSMS